MARRRGRTWSTSCSSTISQSSIASIYAKINQTSPLAEPAKGHTNVHGSFTTTTISAALWLRSHLSLDIPVPGKRRAEQRDFFCGYDTPPDSPLSYFQPLSGSKQSPSITRTLLIDFEQGSPSRDTVAFSPPLPPSPLVDDDANVAQLHPVLAAVEQSSKLSCRTVCSTCMKAGTNFPRCPRCDDMWCSRACRLQGGKKHICAIRKM